MGVQIYSIAEATTVLRTGSRAAHVISKRLNVCVILLSYIIT